jgi:hypothetical protein
MCVFHGVKSRRAAWPRQQFRHIRHTLEANTFLVGKCRRRNCVGDLGKAKYGEVVPLLN